MWDLKIESTSAAAIKTVRAVSISALKADTVLKKLIRHLLHLEAQDGGHVLQPHHLPHSVTNAQDDCDSCSRLT